MEAKTLEIERFITVKFNEKDLIDINKEINYIHDIINEQHKYDSTKYNFNKIKSLNDFQVLIENKINEIKILE